MQYTSEDALEVAENKILMLYILEKVKKGITYKVYLELVTTLTEINYFVFHETLEELIQEGFIQKEEKFKYIAQDKTFDEVLQEGQYISELDKEDEKDEKVITYTLSKLGQESLKVAINMIPRYKQA
jgi:hypothetical protein